MFVPIMIGLFIYFLDFNPKIKNRFNEILISGELIVDLQPAYYDYFLYNAEIMGYNYELLSEFAKKYDLELIIPHYKNKNFKSDIIISVTQKSENGNRQSNIIRKINYVFVCYDSTLNIDDNTYLIKISQKNNILLKNKEKISAFCEENLAKRLKKYHSSFEIYSTKKYEATVSCVVNTDCSILRDTINAWFENLKKTKKYEELQNKYFKNYNRINIGSNFFSINSGSISIYDEEIKKKCKNTDWRFIAALIYEESHFNPKSINKTSRAFGLMQLLPYNYDIYSFDTSLNIENQIYAGIELLNKLNKLINQKITDSVCRTKTILAAYNIGLSHIEDAIRLSEKYNRTDTYNWNSISYYLENLSNIDYYSDTVVRRGKCNGVVGVVYANKIYYRYLNYRNLVVN